MRMIVGMTLAAALLLGACSDDTSAVDEASAGVCDARTNVRDDLDALGTALSDRNFGEAGTAIGDLQASLSALTSSAGDLSEAQRDEVQPQIDAIQSAVGSIDVSQVGSLSEAFDQIKAEIDTALDTIGENDSLSCG